MTVTANFFTHTLSEDGLELSSLGHLSNGKVLRMTVRWPDLKTAQSNYFNAKESAEAKLADSVGQEVGVVDNIRILGQVKKNRITLFTSTGGKPWLLPRFVFGREGTKSFKVGAGWLYGSFIFGFTPIA